MWPSVMSVPSTVATTVSASGVDSSCAFAGSAAKASAAIAVTGSDFRRSSMVISFADAALLGARVRDVDTLTAAPYIAIGSRRACHIAPVVGLHWKRGKQLPFTE